MSKTTTILSTKKLTLAQKELIINGGLSLVEYDAIKIELLTIRDKVEIPHAIFTSKNAVKAVLNSKIKIQNCYCVGENTRKLLEENQQNVIETARNATELAEKLVDRYKNNSFLFFCGNLRRNELPDFLTQNEVDYKEQIVYKTHPSLKEFNRSFDGVLFFSPSAIQSFVLENSIENSVAFCIGDTTASEANKHNASIVVAKKSTIENVIVQAVKYFK